MVRAVRNILWAFMAMLLMAVQPTAVVAKNAHHSTDSAAGSYTIRIAGCVAGSGQASCTGDTLTITATVADENGSNGALGATDLVLDAKDHFAGAGTLFGQTITLNGRLDPTSSGEPAIKTQRLVCTFTTGGGQHGRIAGYVPISASSPDHRNGGHNGDN